MFTAGELLALIEGIYAGILDQAAWDAAIARLCRAMGGEAAALSLHDARSNAVLSVDFVNIDAGYQGSYGELVNLPDMAGAYRAVTAAAVSGAFTGEYLVAAAPDYERSRFRDEWLRPQDVLDMIAAPFLATSAVAGGLYIGRPQAGSCFGTSELGVLRTISPHLAHAVHARLRLDGVASVATAALAALDALNEPILLVDESSAIVHANLAAEAALYRKDGLGTTRSVLACDHADDTATLRQLVGKASARTPLRPGEPLAVQRRSGRRPLSVLVAPLVGKRPVPTGRRATVMVLVADPELTAPSTGDALRATYGLTTAEARVAEALTKHEPLADVADSLGVTLATVRTLLQRAFDKTDTHRQADLIRLMLAHRLPLPRSDSREFREHTME